MKLPTLAQLNEVSLGLHGMDFPSLPMEFKQGVIIIAQSAVLAGILDDLPTNLNIALSESLVEYSGIKEIATQLAEIDVTLSDHIPKIAEWFEKSKVYYP